MNRLGTIRKHVQKKVHKYLAEVGDWRTYNEIGLYVFKAGYNLKLGQLPRIMNRMVADGSVERQIQLSDGGAKKWTFRAKPQQDKTS